MVNSEAVAVVNERRVDVVTAFVGPERSRDSHVGSEMFHLVEIGVCAFVPGSVQALEALSTVCSRTSRYNLPVSKTTVTRIFTSDECSPKTENNGKERNAEIGY
jgi:hypothetical protein